MEKSLTKLRGCAGWSKSLPENGTVWFYFVVKRPEKANANANRVGLHRNKNTGQSSLYIYIVILSSKTYVLKYKLSTNQFD